MKIVNHKIEGVRYEHSPNGWRKVRNPKFLVLHFTAMPDLEAVVRHFKRKSSKVSCHLVLGGDGELVQQKAFNVEGWHVGKSYFNGIRSLNRKSIGIEICNYGATKLHKRSGRVVSRAGNDKRAWDYFNPKGPMGDPDKWIKASHPLEKGRTLHWHKFTDAQLDALDEIIPTLLEKYPSIEYIVGHEEVASPRGRKTDPGPAFPLMYFKGFLEDKGISPIPEKDVAKEYADFVPEDTPAAHAPKAVLSRIPKGEWHYQLQNIDVQHISKIDPAVLVTDPSEVVELNVADMKRLKTRQDGTARKLIAYISIGEAESHRSYWNEKKKPQWLLPENPEWPGNYPVKFWHKAWQRIVKRQAKMAIGIGFDGIFMDKADVYEDIESRFPVLNKMRSTIQSDMSWFIADLARYVRSFDSGNIVVMQNALGLVKKKHVLDAIDFVMKEDFFYGQDTDGKRNANEDIAENMSALTTVQGAGKHFGIVEYVDEKLVRRDLKKLHNVPVFYGNRALDK